MNKSEVNSTTFPFEDVTDDFNVNWAEFRDVNGVLYTVYDGSITISGIVEGISVTGSYTFNVRNDAGQLSIP